MNFPISPQVFEATDGLLLICFAAMTFFAVRHLHEVWTATRNTFKLGILDSIRLLYYENKPSIAHAVFAFALLLRFAVLWHVRHVHDHKLPDDFLTRDAALWYFASNGLLVLAVICWCRNVSPYRIKNWVWVTAIATAAAVSVWFAQ